MRILKSSRAAACTSTSMRPCRPLPEGGLWTFIPCGVCSVRIGRNDIGLVCPRRSAHVCTRLPHQLDNQRHRFFICQRVKSRGVQYRQTLFVFGLKGISLRRCQRQLPAGDYVLRNRNQPCCNRSTGKLMTACPHRCGNFKILKPNSICNRRWLRCRTLRERRVNSNEAFRRASMPGRYQARMASTDNREVILDRQSVGRAATIVGGAGFAHGIHRGANWIAPRRTSLADMGTSEKSMVVSAKD